MNEHLINLTALISNGCMAVGLIFWFWGTWPLIGSRSLLFKLHSLSVADTLGSMLIIISLLLRIPREWPLLVLALLSLAIWNTVLGYVLAYCSTPSAELSTPARPLPFPAPSNSSAHSPSNPPLSPPAQDHG